MTFPSLSLLLGLLLAEWLAAGAPGSSGYRAASLGPLLPRWGWAAALGGLLGLLASSALLAMAPEMLWPQLMGLPLLALLAGLLADRWARGRQRIARAMPSAPDPAPPLPALPQPAIAAALGCLLIGSSTAYLGLIHAGYSLLGLLFAVLAGPHLIRRAEQLQIPVRHRLLLWVIAALAMDHMG